MSSFYTSVPKITIICMLPEIWSATGIIFCYVGPFFAFLHHYWPQKFKFGKNVKNTWRYYPFTYVYHKWRSYDAWFLRYKVQRTASFVILGYFLSFDPPNNLKKSKFWKNEITTSKYYPFTNVHHKWRSYDVWFLRYNSQQTVKKKIGIHSMQGWTATSRHGVTKKRSTKRLKHTENLLRKNHAVKWCLLILDLKPLRS